MKLENIKTSELKRDNFRLTNFKVLLSDLDFCVNIHLHKIFKKKLRSCRYLFEQIRTNSTRSINLSKFLTFNQIRNLINHLVSLYYLTLTPPRDIIKGNRTIENLLKFVSFDTSARNYALKPKFPMNTACMYDLSCATLSGNTNVVSYKWRIVRELQTHLTKITAHVYDVVMLCLQSLGLLTYFRYVNTTKEAYAYSLSPVIIDNQYSDEFPFRLSIRQQQIKEVKQ